jgi:putative peptidoglycan lipid II flippase
LSLFVAWNSRIKAVSSEHRAIVHGMAWVTLFVVLGKLSGAGKEMALAWRYGIGPVVDGYLFVLSLVSWPLALWFSVLTIALVPLAARMRRENPTELPRFRAELLGVTLLLGGLLALMALVLIPLFIQLENGTLPPATAAHARTAIPTLALLLPLGVLSSLFSAWMLAAGLHANTLLEGVPAFVIAIVILFGNGGIESLAWGTAAGFLLHMLLLATPLYPAWRAGAATSWRVIVYMAVLPFLLRCYARRECLDEPH